MIMKRCFFRAALSATGLLVQPLFADDQPGSVPAGTNASSAPLAVKPPGDSEKPAKKKKTAANKKAEPKKVASEPLKATPLVPGPAVVTQKSVNVRAQAAINSEVIVRLKQGDHVNVIEEVTKKAKTDEPAKWAKISLPTNSPVWVNTSFINPDKTVKPNKLNVRSGPGENYTVVARIAKGTVVKDLETKGDWMRIESPADAFGYVASHLLSSEPAAPPPPVIAAIEPPKPVPTTETKFPPPIFPAPAEPVVPPPAPVTPPPANTVATPPVIAAPSPTPAEPAAPVTPPEEVFVKRVISREGIVKRSVSIQAPTYFALESLDTGKTINYLYSPSTNLVLKDLRGKRILVTGEELLDERWPNTPVINVDNLQEVH